MTYSMTYPMTYREAFREAQRRWGTNANVLRVDPRTYRDPHREYWVISDVNQPRYAVIGHGNSWEEAFANAKESESALQEKGRK